MSLVGLMAAACGASQAGGRDGGGTDGHGGHAADAGGDTILAPTGDAVSDGAIDAAAADAAPSPGALRVAHLSPDLPPVDLCVAPQGTAEFQGPLLDELANPDGGQDGGTVGVDGGSGGVAYGEVSAYLPLPAGTYDVRLVPAGATSCAAASADGAADAAVDFLGIAGTVGLPTLDAGARLTLLLAGDRSPVGNDAALELVVLRDDATLAGGAAALRVVNAVPSLPQADFGLGSFTGDWLPLFTRVAFGAAGSVPGPSEGTLDANGYLPIAPLAAGEVLSVRPSVSAATDTAVASTIEIDDGSIATIFAVGGKTGDATHPPALLACVDNQPAGGTLSDCRLSP